MTSRERMLATIGRQETDYVPCSFMIFSALDKRCRDPFEFVRQQIDLGLDAFFQIPRRENKRASEHADLHGLPIRFDPRVTVRQWREDRKDERYPILCHCCPVVGLLRVCN